MPVKIRISLVGKRHAPVHRLVAVDSRSKRDGQSLEVLGTYDPVNHKFAQFHEDRVAHWVSQGAQLTDSAKKLRKLYKDQAAQ